MTATAIDFRKATVLGKVFPVTVDYSLSLEDMIAAGNYDRVTNVTADRFPIVGEGKKDVVIELIPYDRAVTPLGATIDELDTRGLRPAKIEELLALGAKYMELHKRFSIIAPGSVWSSDKGSYGVFDIVPYFQSFYPVDQCILEAGWWGLDWGNYNHIATVQK